MRRISCGQNRLISWLKQAITFATRQHTSSYPLTSSLYRERDQRPLARFTQLTDLRRCRHSRWKLACHADRLTTYPMLTYLQRELLWHKYTFPEGHFPLCILRRQTSHHTMMLCTCHPRVLYPEVIRLQVESHTSPSGAVLRSRAKECWLSA